MTLRLSGHIWLTLSIIVSAVACSSSASLDELLARAQQAVEKEDWRAVEVDAKSILQREPSHVVGRRLLGEVYFHQRRFAESASEFKRALASGDDSAASLMLYAKSLLAAGDSQQLVALYESGAFGLIEEEPAFLATLAWAQVTMAELGAADELLVAAQARGQDCPELRLAEALVTLNASGDLKEVADILQGLTDTFPDYDEGWSLAGYVALMQASLSKAEEAFARSVELNPYRLEDQLLLINTLIDLGKQELANRELQATARKAPRHPGVYFARARLLLDANDANAALEELQKILALDPNHKPSLYLAGAANASAGNPATALEQLSRFVSANPHHVDARLLQGQVYLQLNDSDNARAVARELLAEDPENKAAQRLLIDAAANLPARGLEALRSGREALQRNEQSRARQYFLEALALDPTQMEARQVLTRMAMAAGDTALAVELIEDGLQQQPDNVQGLLDLAGVHIQAGEEAAGVKMLQRAIDVHPEALEPRLVLGRYLLLNGQVDAALQLLEGARALHMNQDALHHLLVAAYLADGQPDKAAESGRALLALMPDHPQALQLMARIERARGDLVAVENYLHRFDVVKLFCTPQLSHFSQFCHLGFILVWALVIQV